MQRTIVMKTGAVLGACAAIGAGAGILGSAGASSASPAKAAGAGKLAGRHGRRLRAGAIIPGRGIHGSVVVPGARGTFRTLTFDRGVVKSVSGTTLTITEGTRRATYRTATVTVPSSAVVRDNRQTVALSALKPGQRVVVVQGTPKMHVVAHDVRAPRTP